MPDWYLLVRAARYLTVPPWDLADKPAFWQAAALIAEGAEADAQERAQKRAQRRRRGAGRA